MAEDLTPPEPADEPGTAIEPTGPPPATELVVAEKPGELVPYQQRPSGLQPEVGRKFNLAYAVVVGVFVLGALGTVMALAGVRPGAPAKWSDFRPKGDGIAKAQAIADYVSPRYRLDDGNQMVVVAAHDAGVGSQSIQFVAVPGRDKYDIIAGEKTIAYDMCGLGDKCSIRTGTPSPDRDRLLRREALEIALYSFKYIGGTDAVVMFMPPPPGENPTWALLFRKSELGTELGAPVTRTLTEPVPNPSGLAASTERDLVDQLTGSTRYSYEVRDVNGAPVLVLDTPPTT